MDNGLFRKKSIDRISSPEALHDYMRVTSPRLWMILTAVVVLLAGFIVFASTATMENTIHIRAQVVRYQEQEEGKQEEKEMTYVAAYFPMDQIDVIKTGMKLRLGQEEGRVSWISASEDDDKLTVLFEMDHSYIPLADGEYDAELILESTTPIRFLWN